MDLFVFHPSLRRARTFQRKDWMPISLTISLDRQIFEPADWTAEDGRMRSNDKPVVGDMRKRITRLCGDRRLLLIPAR